MKFKFSPKEVRDILLSVIILGFVFSFRGWGEDGFSFEAGLNNWFNACLIVGLAFVAHELAHKFVAQGYDASAEYRLWPQGLFISLLLAFLTNGALVFAAPGFVVISAAYFTRIGFKYAHLSVEEGGRIAIAGPAAGIGLALLAKIFQPLLPTPFFTGFVMINAWLALFNLMPFPPLDGSKVMMWSRGWWLFALTASLIALLGFPVLDVFTSLALIGAAFFGTFIVVQKAKI